MNEEMNGKSFSISRLFWPGPILIFIGLIYIISWSAEEPRRNITPRVVKEYTPPTPTLKKPNYHPLPKNKPKVQSNYQPLPKEKPKTQKSNYHPLIKKKSDKPKSNYQPLPEKRSR